MKSQELYRELRAGLGPWFRGEKFKVARGAGLGWCKDQVLVWFQCDQRGWDPYAGSSFFVNFQVGPVPRPWSGRTERLQQFLTDAELEQVRSLQNEVIRKLSAPPAEHVDRLRTAFAPYPDGAGMLEALLQQFQPVAEPYRQGHDVRLRYFSAADVQRWSGFLLGVLPRVLSALTCEAGRPTSGS